MAESSTSLPAFDHDASTFRYTEPPIPGWKYGQKIDSTEEGRKWMAGERQGWTVINSDDKDSVP
jgi:hypothetical protein